LKSCGNKKVKLQKRKVGLALGSGAAKGFAHIGVLTVLGKEGIPIDMIAGTSAGAFIGALYAQGRTTNEIKSLIVDLGRKRLALLTDLALPKTGLIRGRKIEDMLRSIMGDIEFGDLKMPFACVATDIITGEEVVIKQGLVWEGIRASVSIPVILAVARRKGRYLVDGVLTNPVPVSVLREMGADFIIAVNTITDRSKSLKPVSKKPNIFSVIMQTIHIVAYQSLKSSLAGADVVIEPQVASIGYFDFRRAQECILQGELAAQSSILEIKRRLEGG